MAGADAALYRAPRSLVTGSASVSTRIRRSPARARAATRWSARLHVHIHKEGRTKGGGVKQAGLEADEVAGHGLVETKLVCERIVGRDGRQRQQVHRPKEKVAVVARHPHTCVYECVHVWVCEFLCVCERERGRVCVVRTHPSQSGKKGGTCTPSRPWPPIIARPPCT
jgi:hypothetical protein